MKSLITTLKTLAFIIVVIGFSQKVAAQSVTLASPNSQTYTNSISTIFSITDPGGNPQFIKMVFTLTGGYWYNLNGPQTDTLTMKKDTTGSQTFSIYTQRLDTSSKFTSPTTTMPDGTYSVYVEFGTHATDSIVKSITKTGVSIDATTLPAFLYSPAANGIARTDSIIFKDSIPEFYANGSKKLVFVGTVTDTLSLSNSVRKDSLRLHANNFALDAPTVTAYNSSSLPDGKYSVELIYKDFNGHSAVITTDTNFVIRSYTPALTLFTPAANSIGKDIKLSYIIPVQPYQGSVMAIAVRQDSAETTFPLSDTFGSIQTRDITTLVSGTYSLILKYRDYLNNPFDSVVVNNVIVDTYTDTAIVSWPKTGTLHNDTMNFNFSISEAIGDTMVLTIDSMGTTISSLQLKNIVAGFNSIFLDMHNLLSDTAHIASASKTYLVDNLYNFNLTYQDYLDNPSITTTVSNVSVDTKTLTPTLLYPRSNTAYNILPISYLLPEAPYGGSVKLVLDSAGTGVTDTLTMEDESLSSTAFLNPHQLGAIFPVVSATNDSISDGVYNVTLLYQDGLRNPAASVTDTNITIDTHTQTPLILLPTSSSKNGSLLNVIFTIPEATSATSLIFNGAGVTDTLVLQNIAAGTDTFALNMHKFSTSTYVHASTIDSLNDGVYSMTLSYQDALGNPAASATVSNVTIDMHTQAPVITLPASNTAVREQMNLHFTIPEAYLPGSVLLSFSYAATNYSLGLRNLVVGSNNLVLDAHNLSSSSYVSFASSDSIIDGTYNISLVYIDSLGNPSASTTDSSITIDTYTQSPAILLPFSFSASTSPLKVLFSLPEMYEAGSLKLTFDSAGTVKNTITLTGLTAGIDSVMLNVSNLTASAHVQSASVGSLIDGIYNITLSYQDTLANPAASTTVSHVTIDTRTQTPVFILPASRSVNKNPLSVSFVIPESYMPGSATLNFDSAGIFKYSLSLTNISTGTNSFTLNPASLLSSPYVSQVTPSHAVMTDGIYNITLSYQDILGNPAATVVDSNITLDTHTLTPVLTSPVNAAVSGFSSIQLNFSLPENPESGSVEAVFTWNGFSCTEVLTASAAGNYSLTLNPSHLLSSGGVFSGCDSLPDGYVSVYIRYQDALGNPAALSDTGEFFLDRTTEAPILIQPGDNANVSTIMDVSFNMPEFALNNNATLVLTGNDTISMVVQTTGNGLQTYALNCQNLASTSSGLVSASVNAIPQGTYTLKVLYRDTLNNMPASDSQQNILVNYLATGIINETSGVNSLTIYPNPSSGTFTIHSATAGTYAVINELGQTIRLVKLNADNNYSMTLENMAAGSYTIFALNNNEVMHKRLVVLK